MKCFERLRDQKGQGALEYAMILAIVLAVIIVGIRANVFQNAVKAVLGFLNISTTNATAS